MKRHSIFMIVLLIATNSGAMQCIEYKKSFKNNGKCCSLFSGWLRRSSVHNKKDDRIDGESQTPLVSMSSNKSLIIERAKKALCAHQAHAGDHYVDFTDSEIDDTDSDGWVTFDDLHL